jgi:hypothetical protein
MTSEELLLWLTDELEKNSRYVDFDGRPYIFINEFDKKPLIDKIEEKTK